MARPVSGEIKTCEIRREQKNGSTYVYERKYIVTGQFPGQSSQKSSGSCRINCLDRVFSGY